MTETESQETDAAAIVIASAETAGSIVEKNAIMVHSTATLPTTAEQTAFSLDAEMESSTH